MVIAACLLALVATITIVNRRNNDNSQDSLVFEPQDSLIIFGLLISSVLFEYIIKNYFGEKYFIAVFVSVILYFFIFTILNAKREINVKNRQEQVLKVYDALKDIFGKVNPEDVDFANIPFEFKIDKETKAVNYIKIDTSNDDVKSSENDVTFAQYRINKFFTQFQWINTVNLQERELIFKGLPKPPQIAKWPGTDYRPAGWIPLGVSGMGEVGWNLGNPKDLGHSSWVNKFPMGDSLTLSKSEKAKPKDGYELSNGYWTAGTVEVPSAPQSMTVGASGGGKSISVNQIVVIKEK